MSKLDNLGQRVFDLQSQSVEIAITFRASELNEWDADVMIDGTLYNPPYPPYDDWVDAIDGALDLYDKHRHP